MIIILILLAIVSLIGIGFHPEFRKDYLSKEQSTAVKGIFAIIILCSHTSQYVVLTDSLLDSGFNWIIQYLGQTMVAVFSKESFKRLFSYSSKLLAASCISVIYDNVYPLVIGKKFTAADVGQYTRAGQFPGVANDTIVGALNRVAFPILSQVQDDDERLLRIYEKYIELTCFLVFPILMGLCGCAKPLVSFLLTDKWLACVPLMQIICFSRLLNGVTTINLNLLYVKGRSDLVLRLEFIKKSIAFLILFVSMFFNVKVMCYGLVLYSIIATYLNTIYTDKILGYSFWRQIQSVLPYLLVSLVVLAEALLASRFIGSNILSLSVSLLVCIATYWLVSKALNLNAYRESVDLIKSKLRHTRG